MNLKALIEKKNTLLDEMEGILKKADVETRSMSDNELSAFESLKKQAESLTKTISAMQETQRMDEDSDKENEKDKTAEEAEERAFENFIRGTVEERADVNLSVGDNGAVIPSSIANKIIQKVYDISPIYQLATRYHIKGMLSIPYYDESTQKIEMAYATEFVELESTSGKFASIELTGFLAGALSKISKSLINNSQFNVVSFTISAMSKSIAKWIEKELLHGTAGKIEGLKGVIQSVTTTAATAITTDELIDVQESIPDVYQSKAIWIMNKTTRTAIRKLKDNDGNYILNKDATSKWGYTLFGKDIYTSDNMSGIESGKTSIYYGDMSGLAIKLAEDISIEVLREKFATQHAVGVVAWCEIDSKVEDAQKIAKLVQA